jgi:hypothetical protein
MIFKRRVISKKEYLQISTEWHPYFVWWPPVPINWRGDIACAETVERRRPPDAAAVTGRLEYRLRGSDAYGTKELVLS